MEETSTTEKSQDNAQSKDQAGHANNCESPPGKNDNLPGEKQPIRRLLSALQDELGSYSDSPNDATKKFADDLKDAEKEYQGLGDIVRKYQETYDKLDCQLTEVLKNRDELSDWCAQGDLAAVTQTWTSSYQAKERTICCDQWLANRTALNAMRDCPHQSDIKVDEAKDDLDAYKNFEKTVKDRLTDLKSLYDRAKDLNSKQRYNSVCAIRIEYCQVLAELGSVVTWQARAEECSQTQENNQGGGDSKTGNQQQSKDPCNDWTPQTYLGVFTPDWLRKNLQSALRALIQKRYDRFLWYNQWQTTESLAKKGKDACDAFRKIRRDEFIQEAEDVTPNQQEGGSGAGGPESAGGTESAGGAAGYDASSGTGQSGQKTQTGQTEGSTPAGGHGQPGAANQTTPTPNTPREAPQGAAPRRSAA